MFISQLIAGHFYLARPPIISGARYRWTRMPLQLGPETRLTTEQVHIRERDGARAPRLRRPFDVGSELGQARPRRSRRT
jgi:hypothetical protein